MEQVVNVVKFVRKTNKKFSPKVDALELKAALCKYGLIDYTKKTASRKIAIDFRGERLYMGQPLTAGNAKLGKDILIFDLLAQITCPDCRDCWKDCYARRDQHTYKTAWNARLMKTHLAVHNLQLLESLIIKQLGRDKGKHPIVRIHSSGDFFSKEYRDMWIRIAEMFPNIRFYCYSKSPFAPVGSRIRVISSFDSKGRVNFGKHEDMVAHAKEDGGLVCPARDGHTHCGGGSCYYCIYAKKANPFFDIH